MEKEFVPYTEALALKELGFDEPCLTWWYKKEFVYPYWEREFGYNYESGIAKDCVLSPLYQQAFRFFREGHGLCNFINFSGDGFCSGWEDLGNNEHGFENYKTYQEAELECLKKLIEIVKK